VDEAIESFSYCHKNVSAKTFPITCPLFEKNAKLNVGGYIWVHGENALIVGSKGGSKKPTTWTLRARGTIILKTASSCSVVANTITQSRS
jgi:hypothetical protein